MTAMVARRLWQAIVSLALVTVAASLLVALMPGDPALISAGDVSDPRVIAQLRTDLGLDEGLVPRYFGFVGHLIHGDLGTSASLNPGIRVTTLIGRALPTTLSLLVVSLIVALGLALPAGYLAATRQGGKLDRLITATATLFVAVPPFVVGLALITVFAINRSWLPALGYVSFGENPWEWFRHLVLPGTALGAVSAAELARQVRSSFIDVLEQDYIRTASAKGLRRRSVIWKHTFKNAATPMVTVAGLQVARNIGGAAVIEPLFGLSGFGSLAFTAAQRRDLVVMQGVIVVGAIIVIVANALTDILVAYLNPKVSTDG